MRTAEKEAGKAPARFDKIFTLFPNVCDTAFLDSVQRDMHREATMSTEELTMNNISAIYSSSEHAGKRSAAKAARGNRAYALRCTLSSLLAAAGAGSLGFAFWLLAERQKDLVFIDVLIAFAAAAGAVMAACGIAALVRAVKERRRAAK